MRHVSQPRAAVPNWCWPILTKLRPLSQAVLLRPCHTGAKLHARQIRKIRQTEVGWRREVHPAWRDFAGCDLYWLDHWRASGSLAAHGMDPIRGTRIWNRGWFRAAVSHCPERGRRVD